jgi:hypothetical protein
MAKRICLPKEFRDKLKTAFKSGSLKMEDLSMMTSSERNKALSKYVGDASDVVNAKFEQALLSNRKNALREWIKKTIDTPDPIRRDMLKKVDRIEKYLEPDEFNGFLDDLASEKLGLRVTESEAAKIVSLKKDVDTLKAKVNPESPRGSQDRMEYGLAVDRFKVFVGDMKRDAEKMTFSDRKQLVNMPKNIVDLGSMTKSMVATLDDSFVGRQGIKVLYTDPALWFRTFGKSLKVFGEELFAKSPGLFKSRDDAVMSMVRADIYSRPNALNGKYNASKNGYGLGVLHEEAFPTSIPEKLPFLGRFFKASETAFSASALHMRAEIADKLIARAEEMGVDMLDETNATAFGNLVTSMTGRGELTSFASVGDKLNAVFFSPKFLKSNWNTLTAHSFDKAATKESKAVARKNLLKIVSSVGGLLALNEMLRPGSVDWDPRSSNFGKIHIGNRYLDITGGMSGITRLISRIATGTTVSSNTRTKTPYSSEFGKQTMLDEVENFFEGKLSPIAGAIRDILQGKNYDGEKPDFVNTSIGLITPISYEMFVKELRSGNDGILIVALAEGFGFSQNDDVYNAYGKKWDELKEKDNDDYNQALRDVTVNFNKRADRIEASSQWGKMTQEERNDALDKIRSEENDKALRRYGIR